MFLVKKRLEEINIGFLKQVTGNRARWQQDGCWRREGADSMLQVAGTQPLRTYIDRRQATVAEWVATRPIFEVCAQEIWYEGGGR